MRKIFLLAPLFVTLTKGAYASSNGYFGGWFLDDSGNNPIPNLISPNFLFGMDTLCPNPIDNISDLDGRVRILRLPLNGPVEENENCFIKCFKENNLIRDESVSELAHAIELDRNILKLKDTTRDGIINGAIRHNRISIYIDNNYENPMVEIFLDKKAEKTKEATNGIVAFICALKRYERSDVIDKLKEEGFFE